MLLYRCILKQVRRYSDTFRSNTPPLPGSRRKNRDPKDYRRRVLLSVQVWGWLDGEGRGTLHRVGLSTGPAYRALLEEQFLPAYDRLRPGRQRIVLWHNASRVHTGRLVQQWLAGQPRLHLLKMASRLSDLNPIGGCCWVMGARRHVLGSSSLSLVVRVNSSLRIAMVYVNHFGIALRPNVSHNGAVV